MKKRIYIIGNFSFPYGNASGSRVLANGYVLRELGYEVVFIGLDNSLGADSDISKTRNVYDNFTYYNLPYPVGVRGWLDYKKRFSEVVSLLDSNQTYAVITYGSPTLSLFGKLLLNWCKENSILNIVDVVDWLGTGSGGLLHRVIKSIDTNYQKRYLNAKADGVITISSYLQKYYSAKSCPTVVIPPLVNSSRYSHLEPLLQAHSGTRIQLIYVGIPFPVDGRKVDKDSYKDRLDKVIECLYELRNFEFEFNIYGITQEQYMTVVEEHAALLRAMLGKVFFHGAIPNQQALEKIASADFTILFRDVNRMTSSGFPTKFVETISCGTPIITTETSDLSQYLEEGRNGFFINMNDDSRFNQLQKVLTIKEEDILRMKRIAYASKLFAYQNYVEKMRSFLAAL